MAYKRSIPRCRVRRVVRTTVRRTTVRRVRQKIPVRIYVGRNTYKTIWI